jgi:hypothetical protein
MPPVVLCIDFESFVTARVAFQTCISMMPVGGQSAREMQAALDDFTRAHTYYVTAIDGNNVPALLRRQA